MSGLWDKDEENNDEDDLEEEEEDFKTKENRLIFLLDARKEMFELNSKGESHMQNCLSVILSMMKAYIISAESSSIGITFFGTREKDASNISEGVYTLFSLSSLTAAKIRQLQNLIANIGEFHRTIGSMQQDANQSCPLKQALWSCSNAFSQVGSKSTKKNELRRIWIFTNDDDPFADHAIEQDQVLRVCRDCGQNGIEISLWYMNQYETARNHVTPSIFSTDITTNTSYKTTTQGYKTQVLPTQSTYLSSNLPSLNSEARNPDNAVQMSVKKRFDPAIFYTKVILAGSVVSTKKDEDEDDDDLDEEEKLADRMIGADSTGFENKVAKIKKKQFKKRRLGKVLLSLGHNSQKEKVLLSMKIFKMIQVFKKPLHTWLNRTTNEPIKIETKYLNNSTGQRVGELEMDFYLPLTAAGEAKCSITKEEYGAIKVKYNHPEYFNSLSNDVVKFEKQEQTEVAAPVEPAEEVIESHVGLHILQFVPLSSIPIQYLQGVPGGPYFMVADDALIQNSSQALHCLIHSLASQQQVAVVMFQRNAKTAPVMAVLLPQREVLDPEEGFQIHGEGFHLIVLPFQDDIRTNPSTNPPITEENHKGDNFIRNIIHAMNLLPVKDENSKASGAADASLPKLPYLGFSNPSIQQFYAVLQSKALQEEAVSWRAETDDMLQPDVNLLANCEMDILQLKELWGIEDEDVAKHIAKREYASRKRDREPTEGTTEPVARGGAAKKKKTAKDGDEGGDAVGVSPQEIEMYKNMLSTNEMSKQTVAQLKDICKKLELPVSGTKAVLVERIRSKLDA